MDETDLVRRAKTGDREAIGQLLDAHSERAFRLALHILGNEADARDAVQAAFVRAFTRFERFDARCTFRPWLLRIVRNEALNLRRANTTRLAFWRRQSAPERSEISAETAFMVGAGHRELWQAVARLREQDRLVLTLLYFLELSEVEAAEVLGIRRNTVKSRRHAALERLRAVVGRDFPALARQPGDEGAAP